MSALRFATKKGPTGLTPTVVRSQQYPLPPPVCLLSVMAKVPNGSAVVFILGEIDCREGILVAVEKLRYETPEAGVEHTVGIFVKVGDSTDSSRTRYCMYSLGSGGLMD